MQSDEPSRRIQLLREAEVRKIAAGEVIDRPLSVIRELLDNSIDSEADEISVYVDGGGVERIRVVDNGTGMTPDDLKICILPHATSKISRTEDIYSTSTLGFRGEALASIAACSKLEITSTSSDLPEEGYSITVHAGKVIGVSPAPAVPGTTVEVKDLFYSLPGRRRFLKRASSEAQGCKQAFIEKALAFPRITFRYFTDGEMKLYLPAERQTERVAAVFSGSLPPELLESGESELEGTRMEIVLTKPGFSRRDRRLLYVFVNGRRIQEFALIQAMQYGYSEHLPGGSYPAAFLFAEVDPQLVDFNIHPAKREVRFKNLQMIHRATVDLVRSILSKHTLRAGTFARDNYTQQSILKEPHYGYEPPSPAPALPSSPPSSHVSRAERLDIETIRGRLANRKEVSGESTEQLKYHGQVFGLFLLVEYDQSLYIIDQHAAHERIIYERLRSGVRRTGDSDGGREARQTGGSRNVQNLLLPIEIDLDENEEAALERDLDAFEKLGFSLKKREPGSWLLTACPAACLDLKEELAAFIKGERGDSTSLEQELYATISCRAAVMDGEILDDLSGRELAAKALQLENARCPHGRPIWYRVSREELFRFVERT